jgi:hypothetical protein
MPRTIKEHHEVLKELHKATPSKRKSILKTADCGLIKCLCEIVHNTLRGAVPLKKAQKTKLSRHRKILRNIARKGSTWQKKRKIFIQKGGAILPLVLGPLLGAILGNIFN